MALLTAATWWLRLALASRPLGSFLCPRFPSNRDILLSKTGCKVGAACKAAAEFSQECSRLFKELFSRRLSAWLGCSPLLKPALGLLGTLLLLRRGGALRRSVCVLVRASPARLWSAESQGSLAAQAVWQQALLVQVDLRVWAAHLTANVQTQTQAILMRLKYTFSFFFPLANRPFDIKNS